MIDRDIIDRLNELGYYLDLSIHLGIHGEASQGRPVVAGGAGGTMARPPDFGRSVNPISTKGADYAHQLILAPPDFQTFRQPCNSCKEQAHLHLFMSTEIITGTNQSLVEF